MKKFIAIIMLFFISNLTFADRQLETYVNDLLNSTFNILNDNKIALEDKKQKIKNILKDNLDYVEMSRKTLGRLKNNYSPQEINDFTATYQDYVINSYSGSVSSYNGQKVNIKSAKEISPNNYMVQTVISDGNNQIFNVNYLVKNEGGKFKILDVITEGISLIATQKSEFTGILSNNNIEFLIAQLKAKSS
jgi:phospholipid transport system substrate-binding protein